MRLDDMREPTHHFSGHTACMSIYDSYSRNFETPPNCNAWHPCTFHFDHCACWAVLAMHGSVDCFSLQGRPIPLTLHCWAVLAMHGSVDCFSLQGRPIPLTLHCWTRAGHACIRITPLMTHLCTSTRTATCRNYLQRCLPSRPRPTQRRSGGHSRPLLRCM
jgi:hypothetical protein